MSSTCFTERSIKRHSINLIFLLSANFFFSLLSAQTNDINQNDNPAYQPPPGSIASRADNIHGNIRPKMPTLPDTLGTRMLHQQIDQLQQDILSAVKKKLPVQSPDYQRELHMINASLISMIDTIQLSIETDSISNDNEKYISLKKWQVLLKGLSYAFNSGALATRKISLLLYNYREAIELVTNSKSILPVIKKSEPVSGRIMLNAFREEKTAGFNESKEYLLSETFTRDASNFFPMLFEFPDVICADSLLILAARKMPEELYTYSQASGSQLGQRIGSTSDPLVKLIADIAKLPRGRLYFPFLDDLYHKKISLEVIKNTLGEGKQVLYYQLLVKTITGYNDRLARNDTAIAFQAITNRIALTTSYDFVRVINSLHEYKDDVRLKVIKDLNAGELYYLCINGVKDLFTSSYLKIYSRIFSRNASQNSYAFLKTVHFDHFKRFLKMASTFNTLDDFLGRMKKEEADTLMRAFIDDLNDKSNLEDAVDVADSYASIRNKRLRRFILNEIQKKINAEHKDVPGSVRIYSLLATLFLSLDTTTHINLTTTLGMANVYRMENSFLRDGSGKIIIQQFFYGDRDGQYAFDIFLRSFRNINWEIIRSKYWVELKNIKGIPVHIYANLPLDDNTNQAEYAQQMLSDYLKSQEMIPSVIIHRGHSYHLDNTLKLLSPGNKLIFIGSCGGYNQLNQVYKISPLAQIVATKQEGSIVINQPMINYVTELLVNGKSLDWPVIWKTLAIRFKGDNRFQDYVPPYQNLGAILLMVFKGK